MAAEAGRRRTVAEAGAPVQLAVAAGSAVDAELIAAVPERAPAPVMLIVHSVAVVVVASESACVEFV